jgi:FKBP-type peptidyl-prolyl cis-trans isomerase 2
MFALLRRVTAAALPLCLLAAAAAAEEPAAPKVVAEGSKISIEYTLKLDDGSTADTNVGREPLVYEQGKGEMLAALEKQLTGMKVNDTRKVKLSPEEGYGAVNPAAFQTVPASQVPEEARTAGTTMIAEDGSGRRQQVRVHEVKGDQIVVDMNHPLAGKTLHFDVKVLAIQ